MRTSAGRRLGVVWVAATVAWACEVHGVSPVERGRAVTPPDLSHNVVYQADIPATLWRAGRGAVPATGNYVYLATASGDFSYLYAEDSSLTRVSGTAASLSVSVSGAQPKNGRFVGPSDFHLLRRGFYDDSTLLAFDPSVTTSLFWSPTLHCDWQLGWYAIDSLTYVAGTVTSLQLRFERRCTDGSGALRGQIRWRG